MSDFQSINNAINKRAGRKLGPSILVSLSLIALVWFALDYHREIFAVVVAVAVLLGIREIVRAFSARGIYISVVSLALGSVGLAYATWNGGTAGLAIATAIAIPLLLIQLLTKGPEGFVQSATATTLVPIISPKKSWEGLVGSLVFTLAGGALAFHYIMKMHWWIGIIVGLMTVFTATCGDLIESAMKRDLQLKDMGTLLPGHGGILDRLDSVLISAPALWLALELVKRWS